MNEPLLQLPENIRSRLKNFMDPIHDPSGGFRDWTCIMWLELFFLRPCPLFLLITELNKKLDRIHEYCMISHLAGNLTERILKAFFGNMLRAFAHSNEDDCWAIIAKRVM